jgi:diguanylate cyclase (GGDEF)-like protein
MTFYCREKNMDSQVISADFLEKIITIQSRLTEADFDLTKYMHLIAEQMHMLTPATGAIVELIEEDEMVYRAATGTALAHVGLRLKMKNSISGLCVLSNKVLYSSDTECDTRVNKEACRKVKARSLVVTPLIYRGKNVGVLKIISNQPNAFNNDHIHILQLMAGFIASGLAHQLSFENNRNLLNTRTAMLDRLQNEHDILYQLAHYDILTNLANRTTFKKILTTTMQEAKEHPDLTCLMYLDIDHFKSINDTFGHHIGDSLLVAFAGRLKQSIRHENLIARLGGDEFVILLNQLKHRVNAENIAKNIIDRMQHSFQCNEHSLHITTSIGLAFYKGESTLSMDEFIKQADSALYHAKQAGRNTFSIFIN